MNADSEQMRVVYESAVKLNPSDVEAVQYLAVWHLERHSFQQARKYFGHLATLKQFDADVWLCLSVCCAMAEEFTECLTALKTAQNLIPSSEDDVRVKFCHALMSEKRKDYTIAMEGYVTCLNQCAAAAQAQSQEDASSRGQDTNDRTEGGSGGSSTQKLVFMKELRGEVMLRIAVLKKEMGAIDQSMQMCNTITSEPFGDSIRANALCLKGLLHEMRGEFPASEVVYRSVLQITSGHSTALERLGRVYLRYRETIPAAVQCFFKSVETNPSNHVAWYLLGRCYMATSQYSDACEAYNRAVNLNPNDPQVWCSLGVLYYAFGQYREALGMLARALKLDSTMADAWYNVGALYDMCDQSEDAQLAYVKAKENGLADRFARAGMGLNPLAMQSLQYINSSGGGSFGTSGSSNVAATSSTAATSGGGGVGGSSTTGNVNKSTSAAARKAQSAPQPHQHPQQQHPAAQQQQHPAAQQQLHPAAQQQQHPAAQQQQHQYQQHHHQQHMNHQAIQQQHTQIHQQQQMKQLQQQQHMMYQHQVQQQQQQQARAVQQFHQQQQLHHGLQQPLQHQQNQHQQHMTQDQNGLQHQHMQQQLQYQQQMQQHLHSQQHQYQQQHLGTASGREGSPLGQSNPSSSSPSASQANPSHLSAYSDQRSGYNDYSTGPDQEQNDASVGGVGTAVGSGRSGDDGVSNSNEADSGYEHIS